MNRSQAREKAKQLVAQMTVEEAASQLRFDSPAIERLNIPEYNWWNEALHGVARAGVATMYPQAIGLGATFDPELVEELGDVTATEGRAKYNAFSAHGDRDIYKGLTFWSPNINIFRDPRWGRGHETYGEDPILTGEMGAAYVRGIQGKGETMKAAACAKHFAVHSGPESLRHHFDAQVNAKDLHETYLPAFKKLVCEAKVEAVMGAYNRTNGEPCCGHHVLMHDILRGKWGFEGHFVSDCWAINDFHANHHVTETPEQSAALALKEGCDVNCGNTYLHMMQAYEQGLVSEDEIRLAAERLFTTRYMLGIMGEGSEFDGIPYSKVECEEHLQKARKAAEESCVLLKNNGMLPLNPDTLGAIAVIGPNADSRASLIGNYHGTASRYITIQEGIQDALKGKARVYTSEGCALATDKTEGLGRKMDRLSEAIIAAENADAVVLVVGLDETLEGEEGDTGNYSASGDKISLLLPEPQRILMDEVLKVGKPTVICLTAGSAIDLQSAADRADAVLQCWYPGAQGGETVADILFGRVSPSGKLPVTFYKNEQLKEMPEFTDYSMKNRTYRYFAGKPLYPFGYGLTYSKIVLRSADVEETGDACKLTVEAENIGDANTAEVLQIYCQNAGSEFAPLNPRLVAFKRFFCEKGKKKTVCVTIPKENFLVTNREGEQVKDGRVVLYVGFGQPDARTEELTGQKTVSIRL